MRQHRAVINCLRCKKIREHAGRGLCRPCHQATGRNGTRSNYPPFRFQHSSAIEHHEGLRGQGLVHCVCCGRPGRHEARGLIKSCYTRHARHGTLDQFKSQARLPVHNRGETQITPAVLMVLGVLLVESSTELEEWAEEQLGPELVTRAIDAAEAVRIGMSA